MNNIIRISLIIFAVAASNLATAKDFAELVPKPPRLKAKSYILVDAMSGVTLAEFNAEETNEPASLTKIMTVYVVANALKSGSISLDQKTTVSEKAWKMEGSRMFIEVGKQVTVDELLDGVVIQSGNDASVALAEFVAGGEDVFAEEMNQAARQLGMRGSNFSNSTGLPDQNTYVTARDLAVLSAALIKEHPEIYERFKQREFTFNEIKQFNRNRLLARDASVDGIKTGHTEAAGYCLVSSAVKDGMRLIAVVMGTESDEARTEESQKLLNFGYRYFENKRIYNAGDTVASVKAWKGENESLPLSVANDLRITIPRGRFEEIEASAKLPNSVSAPVAQGEKIGEMILTLDATEIARVPLLAKQDLNEGSIFGRLIDEVKMRLE
ncbi:MAG: D-alanyl-D-alanine carboxypeptidase family protein [Gammaproteobacteria bacterium]